MLDDSASFDFSSNLDGCILDLTTDDWSQDTVFSPWSQDSTDGGFYGNMTEYMGQSTDFTCAVVSQQMILSDFGINVSEAQLVYDATSNGWLSDSGTGIDDMGRLLEHYGVSTHANYSGDFPSLVSELAHGHKIIVPVNSGELWHGVSFWQKLTGSHNTGPDHAIVVSGVDFSDPDHPMVVVNDPGSGAGEAQMYPLEHFLEAWNDSNCMYLATDAAPENLASDIRLGAKFDESTDIYMTKEFWLDLGTRIGGSAALGALEGYLGLPFGTFSSQFAFSDSPWETLSDMARDQLFLEI